MRCGGQAVSESNKPMIELGRRSPFAIGVDDKGQVERVNDNKKVCKWACCCRGVIHNDERGAGKYGVESLMEMSGG